MGIKQLFTVLALVIALALFGAKSITIGSEHNITGTVVQKTAMPGYTGNEKHLIVEIDGNSVRVPFDWNEKTLIGGRVPLIKLKKFLFPDDYAVDFNRLIK